MTTYPHRAFSCAATPRRKTISTGSRPVLMRCWQTVRRGKKYGALAISTYEIATPDGLWINDPMTDKPEYKVSSVQKNDEGAVAEIEVKCAQRGLVSFTALVVDPDGKPTVSFPNYNASEQVLIGKRRFNGDDPQAAIFVSDQFNNRFTILFLLGRQPSQAAQTDNARQGNAADGMQLFAKALQVGIVGAQKADETWRVPAQIDTNRGSLILKIPTFDRSIRKLIEACS